MTRLRLFPSFSVYELIDLTDIPVSFRTTPVSTTCSLSCNSCSALCNGHICLLTAIFSILTCQKLGLKMAGVTDTRNI